MLDMLAAPSYPVESVARAASGVAEPDGFAPTATSVLTALAQDVRTAAWLLPANSPLNAYYELLGSLPACPEAWVDVLGGWFDPSRDGQEPQLGDGGEAAGLGALGVMMLRAARDLGPRDPLTGMLRQAARWCFFGVRPQAA
jgi:hypothetical protein